MTASAEHVYGLDRIPSTWVLAAIRIDGPCHFEGEFMNRLRVYVLVMLTTASLAAAHDLPQLIVFEDDYEQGDQHWKPVDPRGWKIKATNKGHVYSQFEEQSDYQPPHRSPFHIGLLSDVLVGDFVMTVRVRSTHPDYDHRDACLFFGYQDPAHFYYVHLGKKADDHANQVFIVNDGPRTKISLKSTPGTPWDDQWHTVRVVRHVHEGVIEVYFDDLKNPVMRAQDTTFRWGQVGIGSFDDTADFDDFQLHGIAATRP